MPHYFLKNLHYVKKFHIPIIIIAYQRKDQLLQIIRLQNPFLSLARDSSFNFLTTHPTSIIVFLLLFSSVRTLTFSFPFRRNLINFKNFSKPLAAFVIFCYEILEILLAVRVKKLLQMFAAKLIPSTRTFEPTKPPLYLASRYLSTLFD